MSLNGIDQSSTDLTLISSGKSEAVKHQDISKFQSFLVKFRELVKRIATSRTTYSVIGALGSITAGAIAVALFCGASFCAPMIPMIIGAVSIGISLIGVIIDIVKGAKDERQHDVERNAALGVEIFGKIGSIIAYSCCASIPVVGQVAIFLRSLALIHSTIDFIGLGAEVGNDYKHGRIEYGDNKLGHALKWFLDLLFGASGQPPQVTSTTDNKEFNKPLPGE